MIVPNVLFDNPNPAIDFDKWKIRVPTQPMPWPVPGIRRASINSFGYGGTNAHVIVDDAYHYLREQALEGKCQTQVLAPQRLASSFSTPSALATAAARGLSSDPRIFYFSANDEKALKTLAKLYAKHLETRTVDDEGVFLEKLSHTLCARRSAFRFVIAMVASSRAELVSKLQAPLTSIEPSTKDAPKLAYIFTGQGAQWWAMGRELIELPVFGATLADCDKAMKGLGVSSWSIVEELRKPRKESRLDDVAISQPLCTAIQMALVDLYASWNIRPMCVAGNSSGEIAAVYTIGAVSLETAMELAHHRGVLASTAKQLGVPSGMLAAGLSEQEALCEMSDLGGAFGEVAIGCVNSPKSTTFSGDLTALVQLQKRLASRGLFARRLQVDMGYHSHHMQPIADDYGRCLAHMALVPPAQRNGIPMYSCVTGEAITSRDLGSEYWARSVVACVRFSDAVAQLCASSPVDMLVELGPHAALAGPVKQILEGRQVLESSKPDREAPIHYQSALVRGHDARRSALAVVATLLVRGYRVKHLRPSPHLSPLPDLPAYCWNHDRTYWSESRLSRDYRFRPSGRSDILGAQVADFNPLEPRWRNFLRVSEQPFLKSHVVQGALVYPAAGFCCMALEALRQLSVMQAKKQHPPPCSFTVREVSIANALIIPETDVGVEIDFSMRPEPTSSVGSSATCSEFRVFSYTTQGGWKEHCRGLVSMTPSSPNSSWSQIAQMGDLVEYETRASLKSVDCEAFYRALHGAGICYGPEFQGLKKISARDNVAVVEMMVPDATSTMPKQVESGCLIHPTTLDCIFQTGLAAASKGDVKNLNQSFVPTFIETLSVPANLTAPSGREYEVVAQIRQLGYRDTGVNIMAYETDPRTPVVRISGLKCVALPNTTHAHGDEPFSKVRELCATAVWEPDDNLLGQRDMGNVPRTLLGVTSKATSLVAKQASQAVILLRPSEMTCGIAAIISAVELILQSRNIDTKVLRLNDLVVERDIMGVVCVSFVEFDEPWLSLISSSDFEILQRMSQETGKLFWITRGETSCPKRAAFLGLARCLRAERQGWPCITIDFDHRNQITPAQVAKLILSVYVRTFEQHSLSEKVTIDQEFSEHGGVLHVQRAVEDYSMNRRIAARTKGIALPDTVQDISQSAVPLRIHLRHLGSFDSFVWEEDVSMSHPVLPGDVEIQIRAVGLTSRDLLIATGNVSDNYLGHECAGVITNIGRNVPLFQLGDRVVALCLGSLATHIQVPFGFVARISDDMDFAAAAALPIANVTADICLNHAARLQQRDTVLIHQAGDSIGQAAVSLARAIGADVFVTVNKETEKQQLVNAYGIDESRISSSADLSFVCGIQAATSGHGVDVILNSLSGETLQAGWKCLAPFGRFVDISKHDADINSRLEMAPFAKNATFSAVDIPFIMRNKPRVVQQAFQNNMEEAMKRDKSRLPIMLMVQPISNIGDAFRGLQAEDHRGKIVLLLNKGDKIKVS